MATYAVSPSFISWLNQHLTKEKPCDSDFTSWKAYLEKAEKDHPSADIRELLKFISHDMMKDPSNPMCTMAESQKNNNDSQYIVDSSSNCTAEVQAIIDKLEKIGVSNEEEWVRLCTDELKTNFKSQNSLVSKFGAKTEMAAFVHEITNKNDLYFCVKNPKSRRCLSCEVTTPTSYISIEYLVE
uniref:Uncharacterized protein n=1 Tax=Panagrolaimus davidi TaxID=227884 RepID=A0A914Q0B1_9BILA